MSLLPSLPSLRSLSLSFPDGRMEGRGRNGGEGKEWRDGKMVRMAAAVAHRSKRMEGVGGKIELLDGGCTTFHPSLQPSGHLCMVSLTHVVPPSHPPPIHPSVHPSHPPAIPSPPSPPPLSQTSFPSFPPSTLTYTTTPYHHPSPPSHRYFINSSTPYQLSSDSLPPSPLHSMRGGRRGCRSCRSSTPPPP